MAQGTQGGGGAEEPPQEAALGDLQQAERILLTAVRNYRMHEPGVAAREASLAVERAAAAFIEARGGEADLEGAAVARRFAELTRDEPDLAETAGAVHDAQVRHESLWRRDRDDVTAEEALKVIVDCGETIQSIAEALQQRLERSPPGIQAWAAWRDLAGSGVDAAPVEAVMLSLRAKDEERTAVEAQLRELSPGGLEAAVQATQAKLHRLETEPHGYTTVEAARRRRRLLGGLDALAREIRRRGLDVALSPHAMRRIEALRPQRDRRPTRAAERPAGGTGEGRG